MKERLCYALLLLIEWMSGCRQESACYTSADRLTSGSLRLLADTKETGAVSLTLCLTHIHWEVNLILLGFWIINVVFFQVEAEIKRGWFFFFSAVLIQLESVLPRLMLYSLTQRMFSNHSGVPP